MVDQELHQQNRKQKLTEIFDEVASTYDRIGSRFFSYFGQRLIENFPPDAGAKVLDVATGRGAVLFPAAKCLKNGHIIGIDISPNMISESAQEISKLGLDNAEVCVMDVENLHYPDQFFDCVFCGFGLAFFPQLPQALSEIRRVLIPGGRFATTLACNDNLGFTWIPELLTSVFPLNYLQTVMQKIVGMIDPWLDPLALKEVLEKAEFKNVKIIQEKADFVFNKVEEYWTMMDSFPPVRAMRAYMEQSAEPKHMEQYRQAVAENLKKNHLQDDGYHHTVNALIVQATVD